MEQAEKGLWMGFGIIFFVMAMIITRIYIGETNQLLELIHKERISTYVMEGELKEERVIE